MPEKTLSIIKPDGVKANRIGKILERVEKAGLTIKALKMISLTKQQAEGFYIVHREKSFYGPLTDFMSEGPVVVMVLQGEDAILRLREIMGATDPAKAKEGTIRRDFAESIERNIIHGSDSPNSAEFEIRYFFNALEIAA